MYMCTQQGGGREGKPVAEDSAWLVPYYNVDTVALSQPHVLGQAVQGRPWVLSKASQCGCHLLFCCGGSARHRDWQGFTTWQQPIQSFQVCAVHGLCMPAYQILRPAPAGPRSMVLHDFLVLSCLPCCTVLVLVQIPGPVAQD